MTTSTKRSNDETEKMRIECRECGFRRVVPISGDQTPAEMLVDHGKATGHKLSLTQLEE